MKINPDAAGMDGERLARIDEHLLRHYVDTGKIAGCQVAVLRRGQLAHLSSVGHADVERHRPVGDDTIWRIYSMTKPITGVALMTLYEHGLFQLTDPVSRFIPAWKDLRVKETAADGSTRLVEPQRPMQVRDLMMHTSGLGYGGAQPRRAAGGRPLPPGARDFTLEEMCSRLAERPLEFHPGTKWLYSVSTDVCARLVEILSGVQFDEYLRTHVFEPLGMTDTGFVVPDEKIGRFAAAYGRDADKRLVLVEDPETSPYRRERKFLSGGGGLVSTTGDYLRFARMLVNGGELDNVRILGPKTVSLMASNHLPGGRTLRDFALPGGYGEVGFDGMGFGLTMAVALDPTQTGVVGSPGEYMWGGAASTIFWVDPAEDMVAVFMTQFMPSGTFNFRGQLKTLIYPAIVE